MYYLKIGNIVPGVRIGSIELGMNRETIETILADYSVRDLADYDVYEGGDVKIWVDKVYNTVTQILVFGHFGGKLFDEFGIGSYLTNIENRLGLSAKEDQDVYIFDELEGICFELSDIEEDWDNILWFKANSPIEAISIYNRIK